MRILYPFSKQDLLQITKTFLIYAKHLSILVIDDLLRWARLSVAGSLVFRRLTVRVTVIVLYNGVVIQPFTHHLLFLHTLG